jgi:hypothetical protein
MVTYGSNTKRWNWMVKMLHIGKVLGLYLSLEAGYRD